MNMASPDPLGVILGPFWVSYLFSSLVIIRVIPVLNPFKNISSHVIGTVITFSFRVCVYCSGNMVLSGIAFREMKSVSFVLEKNT